MYYATTEPNNLTYLMVDNVDYGAFDEPDSAYAWLDENIPDWGDRDVYLESENRRKGDL